MKTKPIDYTGCHPVIKEQLEKGNAVLCKLYYDNKCKYQNTFINGFVIGYDYFNDRGFYVVSMESEVFMYAEPIETKRVLKDPVSLMNTMLSHGWTYRKPLKYDWMCWVSPDESSTFEDQWNLCGKKWNGVTLPDYFYEEIEV